MIKMVPAKLDGNGEVTMLNWRKCYACKKWEKARKETTVGKSVLSETILNWVYNFLRKTYVYAGLPRLPFTSAWLCVWNLVLTSVTSVMTIFDNIIFKRPAHEL